MTTAYWFDLDGTLIGFDKSFETMLEDCLGIEQPTAVHETFRRAMFHALEGFDDTPYVSAFDAIVEAHAISVDPDATAAAFREHELSATKQATGASVILAAVGQLGPVGILTNGDGTQQRAKIAKHGFDSLVDAVLISNEVSVRKPSVEIFDLARERLPATHHVFVGDSYEEDIAGAQDAGFEAVHVRNDEGGPSISLDNLASLGLFLEEPADTH